MSDKYQDNRIKTIMEDNNTKIWGLPAQEGGRSPSLQWYFSNNTSKIDVWANIDGVNKPIRANISAKRAYEYLAIIRSVIENKNKSYSLTLDHLENKWDNTKKAFGKDPKLEVKMVTGRDADGRVFISILSWDKSKPIIPFYFGLDKFSKMSAKGRELSDAEVSELMAKGFVDYISAILPLVAMNEYKAKDKDKDNEDKPKSKPQYSQQSNDYDDDDIPF